MKAGLQRLRWLKLLLLGTTISGLALGQRAVGQQNPDEVAWQQAQSVGTLQAYENYLNQNPTGQFASDAFRCVVELSISLQIRNQ
ncbi:MAG: hypothetical protein AAFY56_02040 [Pseudomonadota bacterium]